MTDKEIIVAIRAEIERRMKHHADRAQIDRSASEAGARQEDEEILSFINSLWEKPKCMYSKDNFTDEDRKTLCDGCRESNCSFYLNEDLEVEFNRFLDEMEGVPRMWHSDEQTEWALNIARHFAHWQKEQMLKESKMSGWVARDKDGSLHIFEVKPRRSADGHQWWDRDYQSTALKSSDFPDLKWEDEPVCVKLAIIKED